MDAEPLDITVRVGCRQTYDASKPTTTLVIVKPHRNRTQEVTQERFIVSPEKTGEEFQNENGNSVYRFVFPTGTTTIEHDALVSVSSQVDNFGVTPRYETLAEVPTSTLRYTLPSRYCDSDILTEFALKEFGHITPGIELVQAICDWTHQKIEYRAGIDSSTTSASQTIKCGYGVCRDFAHVAIALCRSFKFISALGSLLMLALMSLAGDELGLRRGWMRPIPKFPLLRLSSKTSRFGRIRSILSRFLWATLLTCISGLMARRSFITKSSNQVSKETDREVMRKKNVGWGLVYFPHKEWSRLHSASQGQRENGRR